MDYWLAWIVGGFLVGMVLYGHRKGFVRLVVSMTAIFISLLAVHLAMPKTTEVLRLYSPVQGIIMEYMKKSMEFDNGANEAGTTPAQQREFIESMELPPNVKQALIENNNAEIYHILGVENFFDYVSGYLSDMIIGAVGFILVFSLVRLILYFCVKWLDILTRLPILSGINKISGALLGGIQGLVFVWIGCIVITAFSGTPWGMSLLGQVERSSWLNFLYEHNLLHVFVRGLLGAIL